MFNKFAQFFKSRNKRERIMLMCVIGAIALVWASMLNGRNKELNDEIKKLQSRKAVAETIMSRAPEIQAELDKIQKIFDVSKTVSAVDLQIAVEECAKASALTYSISASTTKDAGNFKINTLNLSVQKSELKSYAKFESRISKLEPYVTLSRVSLDGDGNGGVIGRYTISSFEMK